MEKLFVQIFERKKWIVDQVKHQTLLFDQQLASKCLLDGIAPPPWLFSSAPNELNKEELISGLLFPCPPLAVPYSSNYSSLYNKPIVTADKGDLPDSFFTEVRTSNKGFDAADRLAVSPQLPANDVGDSSNGILRLDSSSAICLPDQGIERLSDVSPEPAHSLENFQRSESRQRALELRNSAKSVKSNLRDENNAGVLSGITVSEIATLQCDHVQQLELVESVDISKESCEVEEAKLGEFHESHVEELIAPLLHGLQPLISYSSSDRVPYSKPAVISENEELPDASENIELHAWSKGLVAADGLSDLQQFSVNNTGCDSNGVFKTDSGATSPQDQVNSGISDIDPEPLQSLARVHRSKSRQRALVVRNSAKAAKSFLSLGNDICVYSSVVTGSGIASLQSDQIHESELVKTTDFDNESCEVVGAKVDDFRSKEKSSNIYSGRITRSRSSVQQPSSMREFSHVGSLAYAGRSRNSAKATKSCLSLGNDICVYSSVVTRSGIASLQSDQIHESELVKTADFDNESCEVVGAKVDDFRSKEKSSKICSGRITRSQSSVQQPSSMREFSHVGSLAYAGRSSWYDNNVGCLESSEQKIEENSASLGRSFHSGMVGSSSQLKQRKVGGKLTDVMSASPSLREDDVEQSNDNRSPADKMDHVELHVTEGSKRSVIGISSLQSNQIHESESVKTTDFANEGSEVEGAKVYDFPQKEKSSNIYSGRITRSRSCVQQPSSMRESLHAGSLAYAGRSSRDDYNICCPGSGEQKIEENSASLGRGVRSGMEGSSLQLKKIMVGAKLTDAMSAFQSLREDEIVQSNVSPVDKIDSVRQHMTEGSKSSAVGISCLQSDQIHELESVKITNFDNEGCEVEGAKLCDFQSKEKSSNIYSGRITSSRTSVLEPSSMRESLHASSLAYSGRSSRNDNNICCPESSEQQIEENSAFPERGFCSSVVGSLPQLSQRKEDDVVQSNVYRSPVDRMGHVEQHVSEGSKSSPVGISSLQPEPVHELEVIKPAETYYEICAVKEANIGDFQNKENGSNAYSGRITRSQTSCQQASSTRECLNISNSFYAGRSNSEDRNAGSSKSREKSGKISILSGKFVCNGAEYSWPRHKRRKVEGQLNDFLPASPSLREGGVAQSGVNKNPIVEMYKNGGCNIEGESQSSPKLLVEEDKLSTKERDRSERNTPFTFVQEESEMALVSSFTNQPTGDSKDCSDVEAGVANTSAIIDPSKQCAMGGNELKPGNTEHLSFFSEGSMRERKCLLGGNGKSSQSLVGSPQRHSVDLIGADQIMTEFEGFIMETDNEHSLIIGEGISFDKLDLPKTTIERASVLEQLCKSACMHTPLSHFSTTYKLHPAPNLYQSIPNGLLECIDLRSEPSINDDIFKQLKASYSCFNEEANQAFQGRSYSDCLPFSSSQPTWDRKPFGSPVGKFRDRITSNSASSEKQGSLNPELPCINEENENTDEVADTFREGISSEVASPVGELCDRTTLNSPSLENQGSLNPELLFISEESEETDEVASVCQEGISSLVVPSLFKREPLADITENPNFPASVSEAGIFASRSSLESVKTEYSFTGTCNRAKQKLGPHTSNKKRHTSKEKMSHSISLVENGVNMVSESVHNRFSKPKISRKPSLRKGGQSFANGETKSNNIVSNVTTFIPLVKQKQADAVITGKKGVKVKALEAAEAAKRLAQQKENNRMMKKEALKLERARLEQENLKQLELQKKMKEEERKKKEADMAERKRQREEGERKEKERKKKRVVEAWKQQQENEEKLRAKKQKEVKYGAMDERLNVMKVSKNETVRDNKRGKELGDENLRKMLKTEPMAAVVSSEARETSIVLEVCDASTNCGDNLKATNNLNKATKNDNVGINQNQQPSYDISPYKGSDDEDEEEDEITNTKFVPSWASKSALALVISSQQSVNPEVIFPPESFCSISEVLLPRKLPLK